LHINADENLDVFASSSTENHGAVLFGVGTGSLLTPQPRMFTGLHHALAFAWSPGGADELAGINGTNAVFVEALDSNSPTMEAFDVTNQFPTIGDAVTVHRGDFDGDGSDDVLIHDLDQDECGFFGVSNTAGFLFGAHFPLPWNASYTCHSVAVPRQQNPVWAFVYSIEYDGQLELRMVEGVQEFPYAEFIAGGIVAGALQDLVLVEGLGLVLATPSDTKLVEIDDDGFGCVATFEGLPASERVLGGNFAANDGDEFALVDAEGVLHVWARTP
jgi:hypothetical protein